MQPALRRAEVELGSQVRWRLVMGGLAREFGDRLELVRAWLDAADRGGMPVDPRLWIESPLSASYPACLAVEAAGEQGLEVQWRFLRGAARGIACDRRRLDSADALEDVARRVAGLDAARFAVDLRSNAIVEKLGADFERAAAAGGRAGGGPGSGGRVALPSVELVGEDGEVHGVYGWAGLDEVREAAAAAGADWGAQPLPPVLDALGRFGWLATAEVAAACDLPGPRAAAELWRLAGEWRVRPERRLTGELWSLA